MPLPMQSSADIALAPGAEENGLAVMLSDLVRQNLQTNPHKKGDFDALDGVVGIVADDADVALTLCFDRGALRIHDGVVGVPDFVIRATSDTILALSNMPLRSGRRVWGMNIGGGLPLPRRGDEEGKKLVRSVLQAMKDGSFKVVPRGDSRPAQVTAMLTRLPLLMRLTRVMSVNG